MYRETVIFFLKVIIQQDCHTSPCLVSSVKNMNVLEKDFNSKNINEQSIFLHLKPIQLALDVEILGKIIYSYIRTTLSKINVSECSVRSVC